ncbi:putative bifunctional diguanylate cyclase/phosphodiesterase [Aliiglaciecola sp. SL4]|uniref:putative bifunctional diguanylate cyclase/phosphodiesterase n=1 Tax=Aliiglaciecola sp. SL4 TaxID=3239806 RepID=UPI00355B7D1D
MAAVFLVFALDTPNTHSLKLTWLSVVALITAFRFFDWLYWLIKLRRTKYQALGARNRVVLGVISLSLMWCIYSVVFYESMDLTELALTFAMLCTLSSGANSALSGHKKTAILYTVLLLTPASCMALFSGVTVHVFIGCLGILYNISITFSAARAADLTEETVKLRNENTHMLEKMHQEIAENDAVHDELSQAYSQVIATKESLEKEVERRTDEIRMLSSLDPLTQLYNREAFIHQLSVTATKSIKSGHSVALLFIDLNGFKKINDTLGHKVGDAVLVEIAGRIGAFANDYQAGRWGGDEFLMLLPYADHETAISVANALLARISQPLDVMSNQLCVSATIGIAMLPEHTSSETELVQLADFAMFEQKKLHLSEPRMFTQDLFENLKQIENLRNGLQEAISRKQLYLCYQPIVKCKTKEPWSFEALLRWNFNDNLVGPDTFIPLAEQTGLIHEIGAWVLNRACIDASQWQHSPNASVSVNVSITQLLDSDFIWILDKALKTSKLQPERLHLEITESMFADNKEKVKAKINAIKDRNVQVSIDDFGTGYSSLSQLQTLNFDTIKIDRSFVLNMHQGGEAIIKATLFIAKQFGCKTVAEGIETEQEALKLSEMGVDYLQGFLFSKPIINDKLRRWVENIET